MSLQVGEIVAGKVSGITKFGAFVVLEGGKSGLVHISEVANSYVSDINEHLQVGQSVNVRILNISEDGKINLSIKKAAPPAEKPADRPAPPRRSNPERPVSPPRHSIPVGTVAPPSENQDFEDRLKKFMQESDSRIADNRMYADRPRKSRRR